MKHKQNSQIENIRQYLLDGNAITPIEALNKFGCFRLAAVINNLKKENLNIETTIIKENGKKFAKYKLI